MRKATATFLVLSLVLASVVVFADAAPVSNVTPEMISEFNAVPTGEVKQKKDWVEILNVSYDEEAGQTGPRNAYKGANAFTRLVTAGALERTETRGQYKKLADIKLAE